jgi:uncharacterized protein YjbI with pentapeptide repeats
MIAQSGGDWIGGVTAVVALLGAVIGVLRYFNYRTRRDRIAAVGAAFETVVDALTSEIEVKRLAAAIRLRRFFDPKSEVGVTGSRRPWRRTPGLESDVEQHVEQHDAVLRRPPSRDLDDPDYSDGNDPDRKVGDAGSRWPWHRPRWSAYARDALAVIAGVLREQPTGNFQKLLADGLTYAPSLVKADLQGTNLQRAYLGDATVAHADFYRADLSHGSLKRAAARKAQFYQARLVGTVLTAADLRCANFFQADLTRAKFGAESSETSLKWVDAHGADFKRARLVDTVFTATDLRRANFRQANLTRARFVAETSHGWCRWADAQGADFGEATLVDTVFTETDLRGAKFGKAELTGAHFAGTRLAGANFADGRDIPPEVCRHLDKSGCFVGPDEPLPPHTLALGSRPQLFVSRPTVLTASQQAMWRLVEDTLTAAGADPVTVTRHEYPPVGVLADVRRVMAGCCGLVVLGFRQLEISAGCWRPGTPEEQATEGLALATQWNQVEAGMAAALGLPVFVVREPGVTGGVFELAQDVVAVVVDFDDALAPERATFSLESWVSELVQ